MSDFTFKDHLDGIIRFNDANVFTINFDATTEDITIKKTDDETGQTKTLTINMNQMSFVTSVNGMTGAVVIPNATQTDAGLMSAADKVILDNIAADYSAALTALGVI